MRLAALRTLCLTYRVVEPAYISPLEPLERSFMVALTRSLHKTPSCRQKKLKLRVRSFPASR